MVARRSLVLAVVGAALAAYVPAVALGDVSSEATLADRYAPVVRLVAQQEPCGGGEPYSPTDVDMVLGNDQVALRGPWEGSNLVKVAPTAADLAAGLPSYHLDFPGDALQPGCTYEDWQRGFGASATPTTYARVRSESGRTALQYWFFYIYNDFNNKHEGDWEMIQLDFDAPDATAALAVSPTDVGYSQHDGAEAADWGASKLEKVGGTHPVVYPAEGSHANYYGPALYLGSSPTEGVGCDNTRGPWRELRPAVKLVPDDRAAMVAEYPLAGVRRQLGREACRVLQRADGAERPFAVGPPDHVGGHPVASGRVRRTGGPHGRAAHDGPLLRRRRRRLESPDVRGARRAAGVPGDAWGAARPAVGAVRMRGDPRSRSRSPAAGPRADPARVASGLPRKPAPLPHDRRALRPGLARHRRHPEAPLRRDPARGAPRRRRGDERRRGRGRAGHRA